MMLDKTYSPQTIETRWYAHWEKAGYFKPTHHGEPYCIVLPPPNVTGSLHMGHGFGFTLIDILIRYQRMSGQNTLWQGGVDHAGIATQMVVERKINAQGKTRHDYGREQFIEAIWQWKNESGNQIEHQLRRLGASIDWTRSRFTMDDAFSKVVRDVFIRLYNDHLIYRGKRLVNWDPVLLTAISDLEVTHTEEEGWLWHIAYPIVGDTNTRLIVATTRPETLLGDVAIAVHPEDERYRTAIGKKVHLPLTDRMIPIIADETVDATFGTGCVKITPAHDFNDYAIGLTHQLVPINILTPHATLNDNVPVMYRGLDRFKARTQVLDQLTTQGLLVDQVKHLLKVPRSERSGAVIEPYLTTQWYVKTTVLAKAAIEAVEKGDIQFIPEHWSKTYFQWMHHIEDWCISRQLWWGHRIPVWYDEHNQCYVGSDEKTVREHYKLASSIVLKQDDDVLDTWFSAALWPFVSLGWPDEKADWQTFFPTRTLITGFDIIFFWVARMIMMSLYLTKRAPFKEVYITGLIRDKDGQKMSKTKGNVLDPLDLIDGITLEKLLNKRLFNFLSPKITKKIEQETRETFPNGIEAYGTDALRMTFCTMATLTRDIRFDMNRLVGYRHFCNKLWNAARYVLINIDNETFPQTIEQPLETLALPNQWMRMKLQQAILDAHHAITHYRFDLFAQGLYEFTWNVFCDWYLELSKPLLASHVKEKTRLYETRYVLITTLETLLCLLHPIIPFITEEIWQHLKAPLHRTVDSIMQLPYPTITQPMTHPSALIAVEWLQNIITAVRTLRAEKKIAPNQPIDLLLRFGNTQDRQYSQTHETLLIALAKLKTITWLNANDVMPPAAATLVGELEMFIPLDHTTQQAEKHRLENEMIQLRTEIQHIETKLKNENFIHRAPKEVVQKETMRYELLQKTYLQQEKILHQLIQQLQKDSKGTT